MHLVPLSSHHHYSFTFLLHQPKPSDQKKVKPAPPPAQSLQQERRIPPAAMSGDIEEPMGDDDAEMGDMSGRRGLGGVTYGAYMNGDGK